MNAYQFEEEINNIIDDNSTIESSIYKIESFFIKNNFNYIIKKRDSDINEYFIFLKECVVSIIFVFDSLDKSYCFDEILFFVYENINSIYEYKIFSFKYIFDIIRKEK